MIANVSNFSQSGWNCNFYFIESATLMNELDSDTADYYIDKSAFQIMIETK